MPNGDLALCVVIRTAAELDCACHQVRRIPYASARRTAPTMFGGSGTNPYDDLVNKATDENLTSENWEIILNLCDKVTDEGPEGARSALASLLKRLVHRNPNVQLYALSVAEALSKNCGVEVNREIASRAWTQGLEKVITDRNTHDKVRKRALSLIAQWTDEFRDDETLGIMEDCYNSLKAKSTSGTATSGIDLDELAQTTSLKRRMSHHLQRSMTRLGGGKKRSCNASWR